MCNESGMYKYLEIYVNHSLQLWEYHIVYAIFMIFTQRKNTVCTLPRYNHCHVSFIQLSHKKVTCSSIVHIYSVRTHARWTWHSRRKREDDLERHWCRVSSDVVWNVPLDWRTMVLTISSCSVSICSNWRRLCLASSYKVENEYDDKLYSLKLYFECQTWKYFVSTINKLQIYLTEKNQHKYKKQIFNIRFTSYR